MGIILQELTVHQPQIKWVLNSLKRESQTSAGDASMTLTIPENSGTEAWKF